MNVLQRDFFGSATGPLAAAQPPVRIVFGAALVTACVIAPAGLGTGALFTLALALLALAAAAPRPSVVSAVLRFGLLLHVPLLLILLVPRAYASGTAAHGAAPLDAVLAVAATIALKGTVALLITLSIVATLHATQLHAALCALPLPRTMRLLLVQVAHQAGILFGETIRIRQAVAVRRAGRRTAWRIAAGLPQAWLERVASRAARTADAMEVRGYITAPQPRFPSPRQWCPVDVAAMGCAAIALTLALLLHAV
jgi:energy-coupling factor transporter transmembrane protein EcfT